ncbi:MAG TPA: 23S rRNA (adenine(2503)-C(2))-methyltransferase RlmN [Spirochaetia bacterium]|nr:23S rRNA (adenine(2503)-C(2))-methyltransferase RlmN [Spirochaetia bacterium]
MKSVFSLSIKDWEVFLEEKGEQKFRLKQILEWIYRKRVSSFSEMGNLSKGLRESLTQSFFFEPLSVKTVLESKNDPGTKKILLETEDQLPVEMVLIPNEKGKETLCLSSQSGCPLACGFCATGGMGFLRNLSAEEILYQFYLALKEYSLSNVVFMGMGEPFLNPALFEVLDKMTLKDFFAFPDRDITVSTAGIPDGIMKMSDYKQIRLAWSYHSSFDEKRAKLFPGLSKTISLEDIKKAFIQYQKMTKKRITLEYLLIGGINTQRDEAMALKKLSRDLFFHLNLIAYNPHPYSEYQKPSRKEIIDFLGFFNDSGIDVSLRKSKGKDIQGACGQLAAKSL